MSLNVEVEVGSEIIVEYLNQSLSMWVMDLKFYPAIAGHYLQLMHEDIGFIEC
ncbi:hypothetical protein [Shewanella halifaxensis]|uniref:hypothetical protein n=1 Tax=Shewanella halifaxensis TaxID=271098 RepID=UPI0013A63DBE|nr:hypothetical protein [Shewanella halifaxensis]